MDALTLNGKQVPIDLPSLGMREMLNELLVAHGSGSSWRFVVGAYIGLCSPSVAAEAKASRAVAYRDPLAFGDIVYSHLRAQGISGPEIDLAAGPLYELVRGNLFPRAQEVEDKKSFTEPEPAAST